MSVEARSGEVWTARSNDGEQSLDLYLIGRSRQDRRLWVAAPLIDARQACRYDVCAAAEAIAVWCFIWVEHARLGAYQRSLSAHHDEVVALYRFLVTGEGAEPEGKPHDPSFARELSEKTRAFVWRGDPDSWAV